MRYTILTLLLAVLVLVGCRKYNNGPLENYTEDYIFDPNDTIGVVPQQVLANIYADMPTGFNRIGGDLLDAATDDALPSRTGTSIQTISLGSLNSNNHPDNAWNKNYGGIRKVNLFLSKIDVIKKPNEVKIWKGEARFLRAFFYFELLKRYGGVPLIGEQVFTSDDKIQVARNSFEECVNYIVAECDAVKTLVRTEPTNTTDFGKAYRGTALALKARVLLYAASPLYNGGVPAEASASQKALMGYPAFDAERWNKAAQAANDFLAIQTSYPLEATYNNIFLTRKSTEVVLSYLRGTTTDIESNNGPVGFAQGNLGSGATSPTQELVNAFPMLNGKGINDAGSGYDATKPYDNRDPRLANTVLRNGSTWLNRPIQTFEGGLDKPNRGGVQTRTSYYMRKFMGNFSTSATYSAQNHNFVIFRTTEMLLNYAEALNEYSGPVANVATQLINIRKRAGLTAGADSRYGIPAIASLTKDQMRELIRNERRIEMAFEEQRYWDVRRWKIAEQVLNRNLTGLTVTDNGAGVVTYQTMVAGKIVFQAPRMYYYAIPYDEVTKNTNLIQNYGW
jgi:hypothetical protein